MHFEELNDTLVILFLKKRFYHSNEFGQIKCCKQLFGYLTLCDFNQQEQHNSFVVTHQQSHCFMCNLSMKSSSLRSINKMTNK
ncbi:hypothetical protein EGR_10397 [Echinococcus granulosus]|uniref:Uncharacterized protein n=1 Tax=Echinococcus granulosus TaxID=6210 RepID=W6U0U4_ECHGR|nr:hypothetical protein EGR_10397 [Echinococcus granulosus]EUB54735.1 hypothetical protein EGR_10397 [Echinococcus granulosus]